jgi:rod shape determining protein RodA
MAAPVVPSHSSPISASASFGRGTWRDLDWVLLLLVLVLSLWGCATIYSASRPADETFVAAPRRAGASAETSSPVREGGRALTDLRSSRTERSNDALKQGMFIVLGLAAMCGLALANYQFLMHLQAPVYFGNLLLLGAVLVPGVGKLVNGARSWIKFGPFLLQPAEFCKVAVIVCLAAWVCRRQDKIERFSTVLWSLAYIAPPLLLILKQPDFGTTLSISSIWFGMMFFGGARLRHLGAVALVAICLFGAMWRFDKVLKPHQKARLAVFLERNPSKMARREGYQIEQSQVAIGAGQLAGQGYTKGMQNRAKYVPENATDFIFTVVAEEWGFIGASVLLLCYLGLLLRAASAAISTDNYFGVLIAGGFTALVAFHCIVNLGMTMRVMPITGVPLPFFSYGGSSYLAFSMCAGLVQSIARSRRRVV